jgi:hypothetical protein
MARVFVTSDDLTTRVEIAQDEDTGAHRAGCFRCTAFNLVADTHAQWSIGDTIEVAGIHADRCDGADAS